MLHNFDPGNPRINLKARVAITNMEIKTSVSLEIPVHQKLTDGIKSTLYVNHLLGSGNIWLIRR